MYWGRQIWGDVDSGSESRVYLELSEYLICQDILREIWIFGRISCSISYERLNNIKKKDDMKLRETRSRARKESYWDTLCGLDVVYVLA